MKKCVKCRKMFLCEFATDDVINCDKYERQPNQSELEAMSKPYELKQIEQMKKANKKI